ncbi:hypothetical protein [uncultured Pseudokineococcus sp.]|uniref:hypothetical protein n=1 Tax=uncultured Pseudokineococcus sp. TaxID=1642928 RepID=UPI00260C766F|nr:hypothetical protein [uncultured Pseudokineococcus sp.]
MSEGPGPAGGSTHAALLDARARVVHDLGAHGLDAPAHVDVVDVAVRERRWWLDAWPEGADHVAGQVAQDVQESLLDELGVHWPRCSLAHPGEEPDPHVLHVLPDLGPDPHWACEETGAAAAPLGALRALGD